jgi:hypothetical protein
MAINTIEVSTKGKWSRVPALNVDGKNIIVRGRWLRTAFIHNEEWLETEVGDPALCVRTLKNQEPDGLSADIFTFAQKISATSPKYAYPVEWDSVAAVPITTFTNWWEGLPQETRKNVRRSRKRGVVVQVRKLDASLLQDLVDLNNDSPLRQGKVFTHYGKTRDQVTKDQVDFLDRSDYICAYTDQELIGIVKLVYRGDVASILTFLPKARHNDKRPANALIAKVVELCEEKGMSYLTYGMFNYGNKRDTPLREFKIRNGFNEVLVPRFYVPLSLKGTVSVRLKLHRGLLGLMPHSVITILVNTRARLQAFYLSRCSSMSERSNRNRQMECSNPPAGSNL